MDRARLLGFAFLLGVVIVALEPSAIQSQQSSNNQAKGYVLPKGGVLGNPDRLFDLLSQGKNTLTISETGIIRGMLRRFANELDLGDEINREQFTAFCKALTAKVALSGLDSEPRLGNAWEMTAAIEFKRRDINTDFVLDRDEVENRLKDTIFLWDRNKDGVLDFDEYKAFYAWKMLDRVRTIGQRLREPPPGTDAKAQIDDDWEARPPVYRHGKLPEGLPDWFAELDLDGDGQIGLYEWRQSGFPLEEFFAADLNGDMLLTPEEVLHHIARIETSDANGTGSSQGSNGGGQRKKSNIWNRGGKKG